MPKLLLIAFWAVLALVVLFAVYRVLVRLEAGRRWQVAILIVAAIGLVCLGWARWGHQP